MIDAFFGSAKVNRRLSFDTAIGYGACVEALSIVCPWESKFVVEDVIPHAIGTSVWDDSVVDADGE